MFITDLLISTLPSDRMYEFNLNWFLKKFTELSKEWDETRAAWLALKEYVETFFNELDVQEEINQKIDDMVAAGEFQQIVLPIIQNYQSPQIVSNVDDMTNNKKMYILESNGHVYSFYNDTWNDTGYIWDSAQNSVVGLRRIRSNETTEAPYNDCDTFPSNSIISFSDANASGIINAPVNQAVVSTFAGSLPSDNFKSQIAVYYADGKSEFYFRATNGTVYSEWTRVKKPLSVGRYFNQAQSENPPAPYNDCDTFPVGEVIAFYSVDNVANTPDGESGISYTLHSDNDRARIQFYFNNQGKMYKRVMWGGSWREWEEVGGIAYLNHTSVANPYNSLDDVPLNKFYINSNNEPIVEGENPELETSGNVMLYGGNDYAYAKVMDIVSPRTGLHAMRGTWAPQAGKTWGSWYPWHYYYNDVPCGGLELYNKIGVIGDSFASGSIYDREGQSLGQFEQYSWIKMLARKFNIPYYGRYSFGGATAQTWFTNTNGLQKFENDNVACDFIFITMGINDTNRTSEEPTGTSADIGTNNDTFYGNYSRLITTVLNKNPNTKILCCGVGRFNAEYNAYSEIIKEIAEYYNVPYIDQWRDTYIACNQYDKEKYSNHPTAMGYASLARAFERMYNLATVTHTEYFKDIVNLPSAPATEYRIRQGTPILTHGSTNYIYKIFPAYVYGKKNIVFITEPHEKFPEGTTINDIQCNYISRISLMGENGAVYNSPANDETLTMECTRLVNERTLTFQITKADGTNFNDNMPDTCSLNLFIRRISVKYIPQ